MRTLVLIMLAIFLAPLLFAATLPNARAQTMPTLAYEVLGETQGERQVFIPARLIVPQVPIQLVIRFLNNDSTPAMGHSFTVDDENRTTRLNSGILNPGQNATLTFTVTSMTRIQLSNGTAFRPEASPTGILFFCVPHRGTGVLGQAMVGEIVLGGAEAEPVAEKGILLRAYWIGIIGIAAMLAWTVISYFVIKTSSRHFIGHREHVRRGLP